MVLILLVIALGIFLMYYLMRTEQADPEETKTSKTPKPSSKKEAKKEQTFRPFSPDFTNSSNKNKISTAADLNKRLAAFSEKDDSEAIDAFLAQPEVNPNQLVNDESPVMCTASRWLLPILKKFKTIEFEVKNKAGLTVMHAFARNEPKTEEVHKYLLSKGGKIDYVSFDGYTPLMLPSGMEAIKWFKFWLTTEQTSMVPWLKGNLK